MNPRLQQQITFICEIDRLKTVLRQTWIMDSSRQENSAEHSWHLALMAIVLAEYAPEGVDLMRVIQQLLVHDLVEIDAGDTFCYDAAAHWDKAAREAQAADRIFGLLPPEQRDEVRALWEEFEAQATPTARFAAALDRLQPLLHNQQTAGGTWKQHGIHEGQVFHRMKQVAEGAPQLWPWVQQVIADCVEAGFIAPPP